MRLFRRGRTSRAPAIVRSVGTTDRLDHLCHVEVFPSLAPRFDSVLRTRLDICEDAETFVLYDPHHTEECQLDEERLGGRAYVGVLTGQYVTRAEARRLLVALDRLSDMHDRGELTDAQLSAERERVLGPRRVVTSSSGTRS